MKSRNVERGVFRIHTTNRSSESPPALRSGRRRHSAGGEHCRARADWPSSKTAVGATYAPGTRGPKLQHVRWKPRDVDRRGVHQKRGRRSRKTNVYRCRPVGLFPGCEPLEHRIEDLPGCRTGRGVDSSRDSIAGGARRPGERRAAIASSTAERPRGAIPLCALAARPGHGPPPTERDRGGEGAPPAVAQRWQVPSGPERPPDGRSVYTTIRGGRSGREAGGSAVGGPPELEVGSSPSVGRGRAEDLDRVGGGRSPAVSRRVTSIAPRTSRASTTSRVVPGVGWTNARS